MKQKVITLEEYQAGKKAAVKQLLARMVQEGEVSLTVHLSYYQVQITKALLNHIADMMKELGQAYEFTVDVVLETNQWKQVIRLYKTLNQFGITVHLKGCEEASAKKIKKYIKKFLLEQVILECETYEEFWKKYHVWKQVGVPILLKGYELTLQEYQEFFKEWCEDKEAVWFVPFKDMVVYLLMGMHTDACEYSSCMGKYLTVDAENRVYFCDKKKENSFMFVLSEKLPDKIYNEKYVEVLGSIIEKRKKCGASCEGFPICRGGCPLGIEENCREYLQKVMYVASFIEKEISNCFVDIENPCIRQLYLSMIAFGYELSSKSE